MGKKNETDVWVQLVRALPDVGAIFVAHTLINLLSGITDDLK